MSYYPTVQTIPTNDWMRRAAQAINYSLTRPIYSIARPTAAYTEIATSGDRVILADNAAGFTITLPSAQRNYARFTFKKMQAAGTITIAAGGGQTIDGAATATITAQYGVLRLVSDNSNWYTV